MPNNNNINEIRYEEFADNPLVAVQIAKKMEEGYVAQSKFEPLMGNDESRPIRTYPHSTMEPYRPKLSDQLHGDGVTGNTDLDKNTDNFNRYSQTINPKLYRNSILSEVDEYRVIKDPQFIADSQRKLQNWMSLQSDRMIIASLTADMSNVVCASNASPKGYYDGKGAKSVKEYCKNITAGDIISVGTIKRAITMARFGIKYNGDQTFALRPSHISQETESGIKLYVTDYVVLLNHYQAEQLQNDPVWIDMHARAGTRGYGENKLFSGLLGSIDNCPVIDMGIWTNTQAGLLDTDVAQSDFAKYVNSAIKFTLGDYAGKSDHPTCIGAVVGGNGIAYVGSPIKFIIDNTADSGTKIKCAVSKILGIAKTRYEVTDDDALRPLYDKQDFGVIGIISSKE